MNTKHKIAANYATALKQQSSAEGAIHQAFQALGSDNQIFSLAEPIEGAYTQLVTELLGPELFEWLMWWMYECDFGTKAGYFHIDGVDYDPKQMTLEQFLETVDAS